jgi:hypothetical protein
MANWTNTEKTDTYRFILTDDLSYILVGEDEGEILVYDTPTVWNNLAKS